MPRLFAPTPFRWTDNVDYPYGWFDVADDSKARAMKSAGKVTDGIVDSSDDLPLQQSIVGLGIPLPPPSGDTTGYTDRVALFATVALAMAGSRRVFVPYFPVPYYIDQTWFAQTGLQVIMAPGAVIKNRDSFTRTVPVTSGQNTVTIADTTGIVPGMYVLDTAANLQAGGNAYGLAAAGMTVSSVVGNTVTFAGVVNGNWTGSGTITIRFYPNHNVFEVPNGVSNVSVINAGGGAGSWAYFDGNRAGHQYPYSLGSDSLANAIRTVNATDLTIDGVCGRNARYHALIGIGRMKRFNVGRFRGESVGYRSFHLHGEDQNGFTDAAIEESHFQYLESEDSNLDGWRTQDNNELNGGIFAVFEHVQGVSFGTIRVKNSRGIGFHMTGKSTLATPSNHIAVGQVYAESCGVGVSCRSALSSVSVAQFHAKGFVNKVANAATLDSADGTWYFVKGNGTVGSYPVRSIQLPAGSINTYGIREGHRVFLSGSTGQASGGLQIAYYSIGTGAGGTDLIYVFRDGATANPYTTVVSGINCYVWTTRNSGLDMYAASAAEKLRSIKFGNVVLENQGQTPWAMQYSSSEIRALDISIGSMTINGGAQFVLPSSMAQFYVGHLHVENVGSGLPDAGGVSGGANMVWQNCSNGTIGRLTTEHTAAGTNGNESSRFDAQCRSIRVLSTGLRVPSSGFIVNCQGPSGMAANSAGYSGPIVFDDPRTNVGAQFTVAGSQISRTDATTLIVTRPTDAP